MGWGMASHDDGDRWRFAVENNCFPAIAQDGKTWVVWVRNSNYKRRTFMADTPSEAIDLAMAEQPRPKGAEY